jgi:hypothetical protein
MKALAVVQGWLREFGLWWLSDALEFAFGAEAHQEGNPGPDRIAMLAGFQGRIRATADVVEERLGRWGGELVGDIIDGIANKLERACGAEAAMDNRELDAEADGIDRHDLFWMDREKCCDLLPNVSQSAAEALRKRTP